MWSLNSVTLIGCSVVIYYPRDDSFFDISTNCSCEQLNKTLSELKSLLVALAYASHVLASTSELAEPDSGAS